MSIDTFGRYSGNLVPKLECGPPGEGLFLSTDDGTFYINNMSV